MQQYFHITLVAIWVAIPSPYFYIPLPTWYPSRAPPAHALSRPRPAIAPAAAENFVIIALNQFKITYETI